MTDSLPIGDPRKTGESGPAGDQRPTGSPAPAGDPRPTGAATFDTEAKADTETTDEGNHLAVHEQVVDLNPKRTRKP